MKMGEKGRAKIFGRQRAFPVSFRRGCAPNEGVKPCTPVAFGAPVSASSGRRIAMPAFIALADSSTSGTNRMPSRKSSPTMRMPSTRASVRTL